MGHERVGILPRRKPWTGIITQIENALGGSSIDTANLASETLRLVRHRYESLRNDRGVQAAFAYLVALTSSNLPDQGGLCSIDPRIAENPSPLQIIANLAVWVRKQNGLPEYSEMACRAAADTIGWWSREKSDQGLLFEKSASAQDIWTTDARGFCEIARVFFSRLTERYLRYFIERGASERASSMEERQNLQSAINDRVDEISRHAFETSKITQSFAAGWFNKNARERKPTDNQVTGFLRVAFAKLQEELLREESRA